MRVIYSKCDRGLSLLHVIISLTCCYSHQFIAVFIRTLILDESTSDDQDVLLQDLMLREMVGAPVEDLVFEMIDIESASDELFARAFVILNRINSTPPDPPLARFNKKKWFEYSVQQMHEMFRFTHADAASLLGCLEVPTRLQFSDYWFESEDALLILL